MYPYEMSGTPLLEQSPSQNYFFRQALDSTHSGSHDSTSEERRFADNVDSGAGVARSARDWEDETWVRVPAAAFC